MYSHSSRFLSRRGFCSCCAVAASPAVNRRWLLPAEAYAEARDIVDTIRDAAATAPLQLHKLRGNVTVIEGSGGNIAVLTGADGKVFVDAGIAATRPRVLDAANSLSQDPIKHLINTHWHFDHTDGNQWLNEQGAAILAHENTHKHLLAAQRVEDWEYNLTAIGRRADGGLLLRKDGPPQPIHAASKVLRSGAYGQRHLGHLL